MKPTKLAILLATATTTLLLATGCTRYGTLTRNLAKDAAIVKAVTPYGTILRIGTTTNSVVVLPDGTVKVNAK